MVLLQTYEVFFQNISEKLIKLHEAIVCRSDNWLDKYSKFDGFVKKMRNYFLWTLGAECLQERQKEATKTVDFNGQYVNKYEYIEKHMYSTRNN